MTHAHDTATPALSVESEYVLVPRDRAHRHAVELEQCSIFAADVGDAIAKSMTDAAADLRLALAAAPAPTPSPAATGGEAKRNIANPFLPGGLGTRLLTAIHACRKDYVYSTDDVEHIPTEWEAVLLEDFVAGVGGDDAFGEIIRDAALATPSPQPAHSDDLAVDRFAVAMKAKLADARAKGKGGWYDETACSQQYLSDELRRHALKPDPLDVANFAMFLHQRNEEIALPSPQPANAVREAAEDTARLDYLDRCNQALNAHYGTTYRWELVQSHNVNRLMLGHMVVDLNDSAANGLPSCRDAIDRARRRTALSTEENR